MIVLGDNVKVYMPNVESMKFIDKLEPIPRRRKRQVYWKGLPRCSGVYFLSDGDEIFYVGESINIDKRIKGHNKMDKKITKIFYLPVVNNCERILLEKAYIMAMKPDRNKESFK